MAGSYRGWSPIGKGEPPTEAAHLPVPLSAANVALFFQRRRLLIIFQLSAFLDLLHDHWLCASVAQSWLDRNFFEPFPLCFRRLLQRMSLLLAFSGRRWGCRSMSVFGANEISQIHGAVF